MGLHLNQVCSGIHAFCPYLNIHPEDKLRIPSSVPLPTEVTLSKTLFASHCLFNGHTRDRCGSLVCWGSQNLKTVLITLLFGHELSPAQNFAVSASLLIRGSGSHPVTRFLPTGEAAGTTRNDTTQGKGTLVPDSNGPNSPVTTRPRITRAPEGC